MFMEKLLYRIEEASALTSRCRTGLYEDIKAGRLGVVKIGKSVRIPADELRAYVDRLKAEAGLAPAVA
jgi:excisionase family DNA binding protein